MRSPGVIIAGTGSGCGKTTVSAGLMAALAGKGLKVQPFKVGPDYVDPMFHTFITGRCSRNLDSWLLDEGTVVRLYLRNAAGCDISVIEGVMGLYDGLGGSSTEGSTAHVSRILKRPVVLVVDARGMSLSAAALVKGYAEFRDGAAVRGVILNRVNSRGLYLLLKSVIEENTGIKVLGYIPRSEEFALPERHLGLVPAGEVPGLKDTLLRLGAAVEKTVDLELLIKMAEDAEEPVDTGPEAVPVSAGKRVRIAVARDSAFSFYYQDNLELLEELGAELAYFSPLADTELPEGIGGLYLGGGYPEVFAGGLSENTAIRESVRSRLADGLPAYAECGGLMYLCRTLTDMRGNSFELSGFLPAHSFMTRSLRRFGYVNVNITGSCVLGEPGGSTRAHEFHYSEVKPEKEGARYCLETCKAGRDGKLTRWKDGIRLGNTLAGYPHLHFLSNTAFAENFVESCRAAGKEKAGYAR